MLGQEGFVDIQVLHRQGIQPIIDRQGFNKAVVALANKLARISWVIVTTGESFDVKQAFKPAA